MAIHDGNLPKRREVPANPRFVAESRAIFKELAELEAQTCANTLYQVIPARFEELADYDKELNKDLPTNAKLEIVYKAASFVRAGDIQTEMEWVCNQIIEQIIKGYSSDIIPATFDAIPDAR